MKTFLLIGPERFRSTDGVIIQGIKNLLEEIYADQLILKYQTLKDNNQMSYEDIITDTKFNGIIVCGTPWLWDNFQRSVKYKNLQTIFSYHTDTPKVFCGIGSCLSLDLLNKKHDILYREEEVDGIRQLYQNTTIITRDSLASKIISNADLEYHELPCPAYFAYGLKPDGSNKKTNILVWCDPAKTISSVDWTNKDKLEKFYDICLAYYKTYDPIVYCSEESDLLTAIKLGLKPKKVNNYIETLDIMKSANNVLSGRVHYAVPAFVQGCSVGIIPIDSRHLVLSDWGCPVINDIKDIAKINNCELELNRFYIKYKEIITKSIDLE
jgi:hypothetical protein